MNILGRILTFLACLGLLVGAGCGRTQNSVAAPPVQYSDEGTELAHNVGAVIQGETAEHVFETKNCLPVPIAIGDDSDIQKTCGCTTLAPSKRQLAPGETATIRMRVNTGGKNGHFRVSAIVKWKTVDGNPWPLHLHIEGTAKPILATHPGLIQFTHDEVSARSTKELLVFNALDVDWSTLRVEFDPPYAKIIKTELHSDHAKLFLSPCPPSDSVDFSATLNVTANLADANRGVERCAISVPVQGTQSIDVQVSPRVVFANWSRELNKGTARFFLRGLRPEGGSAVSAVACDGFRAAWVAKDLSSAHESGYRTVQIELSLSEPEDPSFDSTQARRVRVGFERGPSVEVPVYLVAQQERS